MTSIRGYVYRTVARAGCAIAFSAVLTVGLGATSAHAQTSQNPDRNTAEPKPQNADAPGDSSFGVASAKGYDAGYARGVDDNKNGGSYGYRENETYRTGTEGYSTNLGGEVPYQIVFRQLYARGYSDGFNGRTHYLDATVQSDDPYEQRASRLPITIRRNVVEVIGVATMSSFSDGFERGAAANGYRIGTGRGQYDHLAGIRNPNPTVHAAYRFALDGWEPRSGDRSTYQEEFRKSFLRGYADGFKGGDPTPSARN